MIYIRCTELKAIIPVIHVVGRTHIKNVKYNGYGHHITPTRPNNAQGRLAMAALNTDNDERVYNSNGVERYGAVPSMARNPKYFSNGKERVNVGRLQGDRASRESEDTWNAERHLRDIGA